MKPPNRLFKANYWDDILTAEIKRKLPRSSPAATSQPNVIGVLDVPLQHGSRLECILYDVPHRRPAYEVSRIEAKYFSAQQLAHNKRCNFNLKTWRQFTVTELFNLFNGRYIKHFVTDDNEEIKYKWCYLHLIDPNFPTEFKLLSYNYQTCFLANILPAYPIQGLDKEPFLKALTLSLEKGNKELVSFNKKSGIEKKFIWANPSTRSIVILNAEFGRTNE